MKKFYRIEHKDSGFGVYRNEVFNNIETKLLHHALIRHHGSVPMLDKNPSEHRDFSYSNPNYIKLHDSGRGRFGCDSMKALKDWFGVFFERLLETEEFVVRVYESDFYSEGDSGKQYYFEPKREVKNYVID